jgi:opacity protein-like surface antigen
MSKRTKLIIATAILCIASKSSAFDTVRVGTGLGAAFHEVKSRSTTSQAKEKIRKNSEYVSLFVGYDHLIDQTPLFLGMEAECAHHYAEKTKIGVLSSDDSLKLATNNSVNGSVRMGVSVQNVLIYGKAGVSSSNWKATFVSRTEDVQKKYQKYGRLIGGGVECKFNENFSFGLEHVYVGYNSLEKIHPELNLKLTPTVHTTKLRLIYSF